MLVLGSLLYSDVYNTYEERLVTKFKMGSDKGSLKYTDKYEPGDKPGPNSIGFDENGNLFICDTHNLRIIQTNSDFIITNNIDVSKNIMLSKAIQMFIEQE